ncbi:hypothetical protein OIU76_022151, partial [Salix suchowensis]
MLALKNSLSFFGLCAMKFFLFFFFSFSYYASGKITLVGHLFS